MVPWVTLLKAGLPYVADIVAERLPVFTNRRDEAKNAAELTAQQIAELQHVAQRNAESIKALAEQLQQTVKAVEAAATEHERVLGELKQQVVELEQMRVEVTQERDGLRRRIESARWVSLIAFGTAFLALSLAILSNFA